MRIAGAIGNNENVPKVYSIGAADFADVVLWSRRKSATWKPIEATATTAAQRRTDWDFHHAERLAPTSGNSVTGCD